MRPSRTPATAVAVLLAGVLALGAGACGDDDSADASTCAAAQDFADSLRSLGSVDLAAEGTDGLESALDGVRSAWADFESAAGDQFGDAVDAVDTALGNAVDTASSLGDSGSIGEAADAAAGAVNDVESAWGTLRDQVEAELSDCDLSGG